MGRMLRLLLVALVAVAAWQVSFLLRRETLTPYIKASLPPANDETRVRVTWMGVATMLVDDGETQIMVDAYLTRPSFWHTILHRPLDSDPAVVRAALARAGVRNGALRAVIPIHSHFDHALDAPAVAAETGALLIGSESTANIGRGFGLDESQIRVVAAGAARTTMSFGAFDVTLLRSVHSRGGLYPGDISEPVAFPAPVSAFLMGECYSILLSHRPSGVALLVHGSANFEPDMFDGVKADVVFLGLAGLSRLRDGEAGAAVREGYWRHVVQATGARRIVPIHWEDFWVPVNEDTISLPLVLDDFPRSIDDVLRRASTDKVQVAVAALYEAVDPVGPLV